MSFSTKLYIILSLMVRVSKSKMEPFIVGGVHTTIDQYSHCIYLAIDCSDIWICGASVLNQDILLTAAHCVDVCDVHNPKHLIEAFAGHENLDQVKSIREVGIIQLHGEYDEVTSANDIALIGLKKSLHLGVNIKRIIISPQFPNVQYGDVAGWGIIHEERQDLSKHLKATPQKIRSAFVCSQIGEMKAGMFCAGSTNEDQHHPSSGDSGSAFVTKDYIQLGLVSFRYRRLPALSVYTNVTYYYNWIQYHAKRLYCQILERYPPKPT